jgi:hypothetical protein
LTAACVWVSRALRRAGGGRACAADYRDMSTQPPEGQFSRWAEFAPRLRAMDTRELSVAGVMQSELWLWGDEQIGLFYGGRRRDRSWPASCSRASCSSPPARRGARQRRPPGAPRRRTASRSSPPAQPQAAGRRSGPGTGTRHRGAPASAARGGPPPVSVSSQSAVICARCWSSPITMATRGLLTLHGSLPARHARLS